MDNNTQKDDKRAEFISIISGLDEKGIAQALAMVRDIENESIAGAVACMEALQQLEDAIFNGGKDESLDEYFSNRQAAVSNCISHAGDLSARAVGFMKTLAEYIYFCKETGTPDLNHWKSEASMGHKELTAARQKLAETMGEIEPA